ncbi:MAG: glycoside hydrolase N-terminal domain-containing protein, partial [Bacteroidaceae bacterium]|nr:glycoside hydrolase N-terminal domain-containing protein [Bacteroidaceae bacterium]
MVFTTQSAPAPVPEVAITGSDIAPEEQLALWYDAPATNWVKEALPIGNGDMGAMIFGGIAMERVQFNHKTLWKGSSGATDLGSYLAFGDLYIINRNAKMASGYR